MYNVHWDHESQPSRERSAQFLIEQIAARSAPDNPVIVVGDFNAGETNPALQYLTANDLSDTFRTVHPNASAVGTFNAFRGDTSGEKIDAILTSPRWTVIDAAIVRTNRDGRQPSDHFPVVAILRLIG
jgi:endonuclease/exonuclease/phosphatase family metal-dependent hydrolase